jgi:O-antigen/teichoic acid export membrane protein
MVAMINGSRVLPSLLWKSAERGVVQLLSFAIGVVLARLLTPHEYGTVAFTMVFVSIANVVIQGGYAVALIQKRQVDDLDLSTVFFFNILVALTLIGAVNLAAPYVARAVDNSDLTSILRVLSVSLLPAAFGSVQTAIISRNLQFHKLLYSSLAATLVSGATSLLLAFRGYGAWALVFQHLLFQITSTAVISLSLRWRPTLSASLVRLRALSGFASKVFLANLIDVVYANVAIFLIGRRYGPTDLAYYARGRMFPAALAEYFNGAMQPVLFSAFALEQDSSSRLCAMLRRSISLATFVMFPLMLGLFVVAEDLVCFLLTDKWLPAVPFVRTFSMALAIWPVAATHLQALKALGRGGTYLALESVNKSLGVVALFITLARGTYAIALGFLAVMTISTVVNAYCTARLVSYRPRDQFADLVPQAGYGLAMAAGVFIAGVMLPTPPGVTLLIQVVFGASIYVALAALFRDRSLKYVLSLINVNSLRTHARR